MERLFPCVCIHAACCGLATCTVPSTLLCYTADVLALSDELEFAAIQAIHSQLDDNLDGKVDLSESEEV